MSDKLQQPSSAFDPVDFGFVLLRDFQIPGGVAVYELKNHPSVVGDSNFKRLNLFMTKDGNFVTIWHGLLEPLATEANFSTGVLAAWLKKVKFDFGTYNEE